MEGNDGEATVEMVLLWNTTEDDLCYIHDLSQREVRREREREMSTTLVYKWQIATYSSSFLWVKGSTRSWTTMCTKQPGYCNATTGLQCAPNSLVIAMPLLDYNMHQTAWLLQCHYWTTTCTKQPGHCNATTGLQCAPNSLVIAMPLLDYNVHQTAWSLQCHYWTTTCTKQPGHCNATTGLRRAPNSLVIAMPLLDYNMHQTAWLLQCHYYTENCNSCRTRSGRL